MRAWGKFVVGAMLISALWAVAPCAGGQQNAPHVGYVYPAGGRQGSSFEVTLGGQYLNGLSEAWVSGSGVHLTVLESPHPLQQTQIATWKDRLKELNDKKHAATATTTATATTAATATATTAATATPEPWTEADEREWVQIRLMLAQYQKRTQNVSIAERARVQVLIDGDAAGGKREIRLETPNGISNPIYFYVGQMPEWSKPAAGTVTEAEVNEQGNLRKRIENPEPTPVVDVTAPTIVNGQVAPGGVDQYRFAAQKGERLVVVVHARQLIPYIADAVPGWFQASATLYDANGKELAYADHYGFHPDPVLLYEVPADGQYTVAIHDSIYRGREDFVYRMELGAVPFVSTIFPLGGNAGAKTKVELAGWNLPQRQVTERAGERQKQVQLVWVGEQEFNARPFAFDTLPESEAKEQNHTRKEAQRISLPTIVNGRVNQAGEWEYYEFKGKAGESVEAEVYARRLDSPLDSILTLMDAGGKVLAVNDDFADESAGLITDQADSRIQYKLPGDGNYYLRLGDTERHGGAEYAYRLRVSAPQSDFELRITPSNVNARAGSVVPITVHAERLGGFAGDIAVKLKDAPNGFQLSGNVIAGNQTQVQMTLSVPANSGKNKDNGPRTSRLSLEGSAKIDGKDVERSGEPADDWEQAFFYHHLVTTSDMLVTVSGQQGRPAGWNTPWDRPLELLQVRPTMVKYNVPLNMTGQVSFVLNDPPNGITIGRNEVVPGGVIVYLNAEKATVGLRGNLQISAVIERPNSPAANSPAKPKSSTQTLLMPALPFEVIGRSTQQN